MVQLNSFIVFVIGGHIHGGDMSVWKRDDAITVILNDIQTPI